MLDTNNGNGTEPSTNDAMRVPEHFNSIKHSHLGPILGVLVIMLVLILSGLYIWGGMLSKEAANLETPIVNNEPETPRADADAEMLGTLSPSDELDAIEADIESTQLDSIDGDLNTANAELNAAVTQ